MAFVWDIAKGCESRRLGAHGGHVTSCLCFGANLLLTGAQDGRVRVWDARGGEGSGKPLHTVAAHVLGSGSGAVGDMILTSEDGHVASHVITAGADGRVQVLLPSFPVCFLPFLFALSLLLVAFWHPCRVPFRPD
jgi:WD40 repeat protein